MEKRRERGRLGARGVGECEVECERGTVEKDQGYRRICGGRCLCENGVGIYLSSLRRPGRKKEDVIGCVA
jgi:hypothetical protein